MQIVSKYTREAGVRGLERKLGALCRAAAVHIANNKVKETSHLNGKENIEASTISKQNDDVAVREVWLALCGIRIFLLYIQI